MKEAPKPSRYDEVMKFLCSRAPEDILQFLCGWEHIENVESIGAEVSIASRVADRVFSVVVENAEESEPYLVHFEFQSERDRRMGARLLGYAGGLIYNESKKVLPLVWFVGEKRPSHWPEGQWSRVVSEDWSVEGSGAVIHWREIWLPGGYDAFTFFEQAPPALWPFAATMEGSRSADFVEQIYHRLLYLDVEDSLRQDLLLVSAALLSRKHPWTIIQEVFEMSTWSEYPLIEHFIQQGIAKGMEQGLEKGIEQGIEQGTITAVEVLVRQKFPRIHESTLERLYQLTSDQLHDLLGHILSLEDARSLRRMLQRYESELKD